MNIDLTPEAIFRLKADLSLEPYLRGYVGHDADVLLVLGALREEQLKTQAAIKLLVRCLPIVESDADMMAAVTRFAPLPASDQAHHDSTETDSERLAVELPLFLAGEQPTRP